MDRIADVLALIVVAAIVGNIVGSKYTRGQIQALVNGFAGVLDAATRPVRSA